MADWRLRLGRIPAFVLAFILSAGTVAGADQQQCSYWKTEGEGPGHLGVQLGMLVSTLDKTTLKHRPSLSNPRFFDGLHIKAYFIEEKSLSVETVPCGDGDEVVVGILVGAGVYDFFRQHPSMAWWMADQQRDLKRSGVLDIHIVREDKKTFLWGIKTRRSERNVSDYEVLSRECFRSRGEASAGCDMTAWQTYDIRSNKLK